MSENKELLV